MNQPCTRDINQVYANAKKRSVKSGSFVVRYQGQAYRISKKKLKKVAFRGFVAMVALVGAIKFGGYTIDKFVQHQEIRNIQTMQMNSAQSLLVDNELHVVPIGEEGWDNSYTKIENLSESDLYGLTLYLGSEEAERVVRALGYESWNNYLSMHGYFDKDGKPSIQVWMNYQEAHYLNEQKENVDGRNR